MLYRQMLCLADVICHVRCDRCYNHWGRCYILILFISGRCCCHFMWWKMLNHITAPCNTLYLWQMLLPSGRWNSHSISIILILVLRCYTEPHPICMADGTCICFYLVVRQKAGYHSQGHAVKHTSPSLWSSSRFLFRPGPLYTIC